MDCENLTERQREIIKYAGLEDVSAFAVAGSGKTTVLVCAYLKLLESMNLNIDDAVARILVITFTDDAATEIRQRIREALLKKYGYIGPLNYISTIHSFANDILQHHSIELGINPGYTVGEEYLIAEIMENAYREAKKKMNPQELDLLDEYMSVIDLGRRELELRMIIYTIYWKMKSTGWSIQETQARLFSLKENMKKIEDGEGILSALVKIFSIFHDAVEERKKIRGILSYDDILYYANQLLDKKEIRDRYRNRFNYVIVDEYQDTSLIQQEIIEKISSRGRRVVAGDYFQSIYEWRDATPLLTMDFIRRNGFKILELNENFRSLPEIVDFVNRIFSQLFSMNIRDVKYIPMKPVERDMDPGGAYIISVDGNSTEEMRWDEAEKIANAIESLVSDYFVREKNGEIRKIRYGDIAILFRRRTGMRIYAKVLQKHGIRYSFIERGSFFESEEISTIMKVLISLRDGTWKDLHNANTFEILRFVYGINISDFLSEKGDTIEKFLKHMEKLNSMKDGRKDLLIIEFLRMTDYDLKVLSRPDGLQRYLNIYRFVDLAREKEENGIIKMNEFLDVLKNMQENDDVSSVPIFDPMEDSVRLMTIHSSKGLEFPVVFVADLFSKLNYRTGNVIVDRDAGIFLDIEELIDEDLKKKIQERMRERDYRENIRVLYVAFTRAKQYLFMGIPSYEKGNDSYSKIILDVIDEDSLEYYKERGRKFLEKKGPRITSNENKSFNLDTVKKMGIDPIFLSVSDIKNYYFCPRYLEISRLKLLKNTQYGISLHEFMEGVDFENPPESEFREILDYFLNSSAGDLIKKNMDKVKREYSFHIGYRETIIRGRMDLLLLSPKLLVVDYKTGDEEETDRVQMLVYSYAIKKIFGILPEKCILYYTKNRIFREFEFYESDIKRLESILDEIISSITTGSFFKNTEKCSSCRLIEICRTLEKQN